jgi:transposase InsO family protein
MVNCSSSASRSAKRPSPSTWCEDEGRLRRPGAASCAIRPRALLRSICSLWRPFRLLYVMIILAHDRRRIVYAAVTEHPTAAWLSRQVTEAFPWDTAPRYLLRDRDASYGSEFCNRVEAMGITEVITAPRSPWQNAYVERVIGSIRRECLDHFVIFNERHLRRVLSSYIDYYHRSRTHLSLDQDCPDPALSNDAEAERSSPFRKSPACITATNVSPPDSSRIPAHQWLRGCRYTSPAERAIRACSISNPRRSPPGSARSPSRCLATIRYRSLQLLKFRFR